MKVVLADIAQEGDTLETLRALRQIIADAIDRTTSGRDIASLSRQLQIILGRIAEMEAMQEDDEIAVLLSEQNVSPARYRRARLQHELFEEDEEE